MYLYANCICHGPVHTHTHTQSVRGRERERETAQSTIKQTEREKNLLVASNWHLELELMEHTKVYIEQ